MINLSLAGCGFLGMYHVGVVSAIQQHAPEIIVNNKIAGCSVGAIIAASAICECCLGEIAKNFLDYSVEARSGLLGPMRPSFNIVKLLQQGLRKALPLDAHKICSGRLFVSVTRWRDGKNVLLSQYDSREELIQALICTSFIPGYSGFYIPKFKGVHYWDGYATDNNPILDKNTVLVSPFAGESDICPRLESSSYFSFHFQGTNILLTAENIYRCGKSLLFISDSNQLRDMFNQGHSDAMYFLEQRNLLNKTRDPMRDHKCIKFIFEDNFHVYVAKEAKIRSRKNRIRDADSLRAEIGSSSVCDLFDKPTCPNYANFQGHSYTRMIANWLLNKLLVIFIQFILPVILLCDNCLVTSCIKQVLYVMEKLKVFSEWGLADSASGIRKNTKSLNVLYDLHDDPRRSCNL